MTPTRRKMIHKRRKQAELYGSNLPFDFGVFKPKLGNKRRDMEVLCNKCQTPISVSKITYMIVCRHCGNLIKIQ
jgi:DNA-directed RNA polymerase subunit RPC12/RpoP